MYYVGMLFGIQEVSWILKVESSRSRLLGWKAGMVACRLGGPFVSQVVLAAVAGPHCHKSSETGNVCLKVFGPASV